MTAGQPIPPALYEHVPPFLTSLPFGSTGNYLPINPSLGFHARCAHDPRHVFGHRCDESRQRDRIHVPGAEQLVELRTALAPISRIRTRFSPILSRCRWAPPIHRPPRRVSPSPISCNTRTTQALNSYELNFKLSKRMGRDRTGLDARRHLGTRGHPAIAPLALRRPAADPLQRRFYLAERGDRSLDRCRQLQLTTHNGICLDPNSAAP